MTSDNYNTRQKQVYFKAFQELPQLENVLEQIKEKNASEFQMTILGKVIQFYSDKDMEIPENTSYIKAYWKDLLGKTVNFGQFYNPESGFIFIVGPLVSTFLQKINGRYLATLSSGPYGIFRGIGVTEIEATTYLRLLDSGQYLLILRGFSDEIQKLDMILNSPVEC